MVGDEDVVPVLDRSRDHARRSGLLDLGRAEHVSVVRLVNEIVRSVVSTPGDTTPFRIQEYINTQKVMGVTALIACVDVVIFTALATLGSFLYNLAATMLGGPGDHPRRGLNPSAPSARRGPYVLRCLAVAGCQERTCTFVPDAVHTFNVCMAYGMCAEHALVIGFGPTRAYGGKGRFRLWWQPNRFEAVPADQIASRFVPATGAPSREGL